MMEKMRNRKKKKGFTLIELIVVIAILGILATIAIPRFLGVRADANEAAVKSNLTNIMRAAEMVATQKNIAITNVETADVATALGVASISAGFDGSPTGATYSWNQATGAAWLATQPSSYPATGVNTLTGNVFSRR